MQLGGTTIGAALTAAAAMGASDAMGTAEKAGDGDPPPALYKLLQALDMRTLWWGEAEQLETTGLGDGPRGHRIA